MRVGLFVAELDVKGGTHKQVLRLGQHLREQGHEVTVLSLDFDPGQTYPEFSSLQVVAPQARKSPSRVARGIFRAVAMWTLVSNAPRLDILNIHDNRGVLFFVLMRLRGRMRHTVWQINDLSPSFGIGNYQGRRRPMDRLHRTANRWMARQVDRITVNVGKNSDRVRRHLGKDAAVFHCGVDLPARQPMPDRRDDDGPFQLLSIGVFFPFRNYLGLVDACAWAASRTKVEVRLTIVGDTRYDAELVEIVRQRAAEHGLHLTLRENLSATELEEQWHSSHAFAFVNIDQSWGLAVFEAAAHGKAVILSESVGAAELLSNRDGIKLVDPLSIESMGSAIRDWADSPEQCFESGLRARATVQTMTWSKMYCQPVLRTFEDILQRSG